MIGALVVLALAAASVEGTAARSVAIIVVPTGLDDDDAKQLHARIDAQVKAAGGTPLALSSSLEVKAECLDDPNCARALLRAADAPWLLWVEALRAGPKLQIDARLLDAEGRMVKEGGGVVDLAAVLKGRAAVPAAVLAPLGGPSTTGTTGPPLDGQPAKGADAEPATTTLALPPPLAIAGVGVAAAGLGISLVCVALVPSQLDVINDPASLGAEKETAALMVPTLVVFAVAGLIVGGAGGAMMFLASE